MDPIRMENLRRAAAGESTPVAEPESARCRCTSPPAWQITPFGPPPCYRPATGPDGLCNPCRARHQPAPDPQMCVDCCEPIRAGEAWTDIGEGPAHEDCLWPS